MRYRCNDGVVGIVQTEGTDGSQGADLRMPSRLVRAAVAPLWRPDSGAPVHRPANHVRRDPLLSLSPSTILLSVCISASFSSLRLLLLSSSPSSPLSSSLSPIVFAFLLLPFTRPLSLASLLSPVPPSPDNRRHPSVCLRLLSHTWTLVDFPRVFCLYWWPHFRLPGSIIYTFFLSRETTVAVVILQHCHCAFRFSS